MNPKPESLFTRRRVCAAVMSALLAGQSVAGPIGGQVVGGSGRISQSGATTTINQATQNMAIDWQSYNVNVDERVQYIQPNSSSISLNRILSNNGSTIAGRIDANGQVILVNPNGVFFTPTSVVNVGGIIASGLDIAPSDFMNGNYIFNEVLGTEGKVINSGTINASLGGNVALIGKQVENNGLIVANLGTVSLAAGKQAVLTFDNGGLLGVRVSKEILQDELGVDPAVMNGGEIHAEGGRVILTASTSQDVFSQAVNTAGLDQATSVVVNEDGSFTLGSGADVVNSGTIDTSTVSSDQGVGRIVLLGENVTSSGELRADAAGGNAGEIEVQAQDTTLLTQDSITSARSRNGGTGGTVKVLGDKVGLFDAATVDASGVNGGGQILIGGDQEGNNPSIRNASFIYLSEQSQAFADATDNGNGGKVIAFAANTARIHGGLFARGGSHGGNGGFIETSGLRGFDIQSVPDVSASAGHGGLWLIDPWNISITNTSSTGITYAGGVFTPIADATLSVGDIRNALFSGSVTIETTGTGSSDGNITFEANGDLDYDGISSSLTLEATNNITFVGGSSIFDSAPSSADKLNLTLLAGGSVTVEAGASIATQGGDFHVGYDGAIKPVASFTNNGAISTDAVIPDTTGNPGQNAGNITVYAEGLISGSGTMSAQGSDGRYKSSDNPGGKIGGSGGDVNLTSGFGNISLTGSIVTTGGNGSGDNDTGGSSPDPASGGAAGSVTISAVNGAVGVGAITANGGTGIGADTYNSGDPVPRGGNAGNITIDGNSIQLNNDLKVVGGKPANTSATIVVQGDGGTVTINGPVVLAADNINIDASGNTRGDICFADACTNPTTTSTLDGNGTSLGNLTLAANNVLFSGDLGETTRLGNLSISAASIVNAGTNNINAKSLNVSQSAGFSSGAVNTASSDGTGGDVTISADISGADNSVSVGSIDTSGGKPTSGDGYAGGIVSITGRAITIGAIDTSGGDGQGADAGGGAGGTIQISALEGSGIDPVPSITLNGDVNAAGGAATGTGIAGTTQIADLSLTSTTTANVTIIYPLDFTTGIVLTGSAGDDTLTAASRTNNWLISNNGTGSDGVNDGVLNGNLIFENIENLQGNSSADNFTISDAASIASIDGGAGTNTLTGRSDVPSIWTITAVNEGRVSDNTTPGSPVNYVASFRNVQTVTGGTNADAFVMADGSSIDTINGGAGGNNSLIGRNGPNLWTVTGDSAGTLADNSNSASPLQYAAFSNIQALVGGTDTDRFEIGSSGVISSIDGGTGGGNALVARLGPNTWTYTGAESGWVGDVGGTYVSGFSNIQSFVGGGSDWADLSSSVLGTINVNVASYSGFAGIIGNGAGSTLTGMDGQANTWEIYDLADISPVLPATTSGTRDGTNDGIVNRNQVGQLIFIDFANLVGGDGTDNFVVDATGSTNGSINGGGGTGNSLAGRNVATEWHIVNANAGEVYIDNGGAGFGSSYVSSFSNIQSVIGGTANDTFVYDLNPAGAQISVDGGAGYDSADLSGLATVDVQLGNTGFSNVELIIGNNSNSTLTGTNSGDTWDVTGANSGQVNGSTAFQQFNYLVGGDGNDAFTVQSGGSADSISAGAGDDAVTVDGTVSGQIDGGAGTNDQIVITRSGSQTVHIGSAAVAGDNFLVANFETINANNGATDNVLRADGDNTWVVASANVGNINSSIDFVNFANLVGGGGDDTFTVNTGASIGSITTGGAVNSNSVTVQAGGTVAGAITGGDGDDAIAVQGNAGTIAAGNGANTIGVSGSITGAITSGTGIDDVIVSGSAGSISAGSGNDTVTVSGAVASVIDGGADSDTLNITRSGDQIVHISSTVVAGADFSVTGFETIDASNGATGNTLRADGNNIWTINAADSGNINSSIDFVNFANLTGGTGNDTFNFESGAQLGGLINGGAGTNNRLNVNSSAPTTVRLLDVAPVGSVSNSANTLTAYQIGEVDGSSSVGHTLLGPDTNADWRVTTENSGTLSFGDVGSRTTVVFNGMRNLTGGSGDDTFSLVSNSTPVLVTGLISGGGNTSGGDVLDLTSMTGGASSAVVKLGGGVTNGQINVDGIETITGNDSATLIAADINNDWVISGARSGTVNQNTSTPISFSRFAQLTGGNGDDNFRVTFDGALTASIDGGGQYVADTVDYSSQSTVVVNFGSTNFNGITGIEGVVGNGRSSTLNGPASGAANWTISGMNSGTLTDGSASLTFQGFNYLSGGAGDDTFLVSGNGSLGYSDSAFIPGLITGGGGSNVLNVALSGASTSSAQVDYVGTGSSDVVSITNSSGNPYTSVYTPSVSVIDGNNATNTGTYSQLQYHYSNNVNIDTSFAVNYRGVNTVNSNQQVALMTVNAPAASGTANLGNGVFQVGSLTPVNYTNVKDMTVAAPGNTIYLNGVILPTGTLSLTGDVVQDLTDAYTSGVTAQGLILDSVGTAGGQSSRITTDVGVLSVFNTGAVYVDEQNGIDLAGMNTSGLVDILAQGNITNSGALISIGDLAIDTQGNIVLDADNMLSGQLSFNSHAHDVSLVNGAATNLASVNAQNLTIRSTGDISDSGTIIVADGTVLTSDGAITLDTVNNDFHNVDVIRASRVNLHDVDRIDGGSISAGAINLTTANGVGLSGSPLNTNTANLTINNSSNGGVYVANNGALQVSITNMGDIYLDNNGNVTVDRLYTNGGDYSSDPSHYTGDVTLVTHGQLASALGAHSHVEAPDIVAENLTVSTLQADLGVPSRPVSIRVNNQFTFFGAQGYVYYFGERPRDVIGAADLVEFSGITGFSGQQLIDIESLGEVDEAVFTAVRNYYYEDVAIMLPADQRMTGDDDDEEHRRRGSVN